MLSFPSDRVDFGPVIDHKMDLLDRAYANFQSRATNEQRAAFARFCEEQASWLDDVAQFLALKEHHGLRPWHEWETGAATRQPDALARWQASLASEIESQKYRQWQFFEQWLALKQYANEQGIRVIGDIPIFVALDSTDVWANPHLFHLDEDLQPVVVSGVPPDYFSETGQLWGHPLYRWDVMARNGYAWWIDRFRMAFTQCDVVRIDHFRGFYNYWEVPAGEKTAIKGRWLYGPGADLFHAVTAALGKVAIIAEDLGDFDDESRAGVDALQAGFGYPGMKVLQFAFSTGPTDPFLPHNYDSPDWVVYTGTHDNDTTLGWYQVTSTEDERDYARKYLATDGSDIACDLIRLGWASTANTAMTTVQDLLDLGHEARMNTPSTVGPPNWCWRLLPGALTGDIARRLLDLTAIYGRMASG
jgi:4-alpha-glucanotransferase